MLERKLILDPGAWTMKLYDPKSKSVSAERSCYYQDHEQIIVGKPALQAYWEQGKSRLRYPLSQGEIQGDIEPVFDRVSEKAQISSRLLKPSLMVILPEDVLEKQRKVWSQIGLNKGFRKVDFVSTMDVMKRDCGVVVHAGWSCTEIGLFYGGKLISWTKLMYGGREMDEQIIDHVASSSKALIFNEDAAVMKEMASSAFWEQRTPMLGCTALNYTSQFVHLDVPSTSLWPMMESVLDQIVQWTRDLITKQGAEIMEALLARDISLSGGLAKCYGLQQMLEQEVHTKVSIESEPEDILLKKAVRCKGR